MANNDSTLPEGLRALESRDVVIEKCKRITGREPNSAHAREIASHITQGRQYFEAAATAGELVRPLLAYYGALSLVRALIMFRTHRRETALSPAHGLSPVEWGKTLHEGLAHFLQLRMRACRGTFSDIALATENADDLLCLTLPQGTRPQVTVLGSHTFPAEFEFNVAAIWYRIPELQPSLAATHGASMWCWPALFARQYQELIIELLEFQGRVPTEAEAKLMLSLGREATFPNGSLQRIPLKFLDAEVGPRVLQIRGIPCENTDALSRLLQQFKRGTRGGSWVVAPIGPVRLSKLSLLFAAAYAAGMLVRYHPTRWQDLVRHEKGDRALVVLRKSVELVEEEAPDLVYEAMLRPVPGQAAPRDGESHEGAPRSLASDRN